MLGNQEKPVCRVTPDRALRTKPLALAADAASYGVSMGSMCAWRALTGVAVFPIRLEGGKNEVVGGACSEGERGQGGLGNGILGAQAYFGCTCRSVPGVRDWIALRKCQRNSASQLPEAQVELGGRYFRRGRSRVTPEGRGRIERQESGADGMNRSREVQEIAPVECLSRESSDSFPSPGEYRRAARK